MKLLVPILLVSVGFMGTASADPLPKKGEHEHKAPHGGTVNTVGKYHVELVVTDNELRIYVLDNAEETLSPENRDPKLVLQIPKKQKQKP